MDSSNSLGHRLLPPSGTPPCKRSSQHCLCHPFRNGPLFLFVLVILFTFYTVYPQHCHAIIFGSDPFSYLYWYCSYSVYNVHHGTSCSQRWVISYVASQTNHSGYRSAASKILTHHDQKKMTRTDKAKDKEKYLILQSRPTKVVTGQV